MRRGFGTLPVVLRTSANVRESCEEGVLDPRVAASVSRALFIGRSVIDVTSLVDAYPAPDAKVKALASDIIPGGAALNAAVTFARLGGEAHLASAFGDAGPVPRPALRRPAPARRDAHRHMCRLPTTASRYPPSSRPEAPASG